MVLFSLKDKLASFVGTVVNQLYITASLVFSTAESVHKGLGTTTLYDIFEFHFPWDAFAIDNGFTIIQERPKKELQLAYISQQQFPSKEKAIDAMKFDLAMAMTSAIPNMYQNPRNVYGIMSPYQQERIDRQEYEFIDYSPELTHANPIANQRQIHKSSFATKNRWLNLKKKVI